MARNRSLSLCIVENQTYAQLHGCKKEQVFLTTIGVKAELWNDLLSVLPSLCSIIDSYSFFIVFHIIGSSCIGI